MPALRGIVFELLLKKQMQNQENNTNREAPKATSGNASNPSPKDQKVATAGTSQLIDPKGEKYLRESANIEDLPDAEEERE